MKYASVCSGVEAASLAWEPLGWEPVWFSQYDPEHNYKLGPDFPSAVLKARWSHIPNLGDMTKLRDHDEYKKEFDLLVGGTPCQGFSIAGLRKGLDDSRGQLTLEYVRILKEKQPRWFVWENVPGVLSSNGGQDFATFIGALHEIGYSFAWRILDAQYCGVPQRRRRVFVVGHLGTDWRPPAAVLFEPQSMPGYFKPSKSQGEKVARRTKFRVKATSEGGLKDVTMSLTASYGTGGADLASKPLLHIQPFDMQAIGQYGSGAVSSTVKARDYKDATDLVVGALDTECGFQKQTHQSIKAGQVHDKATRFKGGGSGRKNDGGGNGLGVGGRDDPMYTVTSGDKHAICVQGSMIGRNDKAGPQGSGVNKNVAFTLNTTDKHAVQESNVVRRLTPVECERLQGMPEHHTNIIWKGKHAPAGQRYKAIGNSMAVPAMHWIGKRIAFVEGVINGGI